MTRTSDQFESRDKRDLYRLLPGVNEIVTSPPCTELLDIYPRSRVLQAIRATLARIRREIAAGAHTADSLQALVLDLSDHIAAALSAPRKYSLRRVVNATGVILHTNLGRAPLSEMAIAHISEVAEGYCNLEMDLDTGKRTRRDIHVESLLLRVLGLDSESCGAVIANNCAAATFLALNSLAEGREVIVSRGELVEIGGGFRIPEILEKSGALLREVGTTNRTRLSDYEHALSPATALILRVHRSNFSIEGFTERPALTDLIALAKRVGVPLFEDQGTGLLTPLENYGIAGEDTLPSSLRSGVDLVASSGDKLLGGPQCGVLWGRKELILRVGKNPMMRVCRADKLAYAALEATLFDYEEELASAIPLHQMLAASPDDLMCRCRRISEQLRSTQLSIEVVPVESVIGGGTAPRATLPSYAIALRHASQTAEQLSLSLRHLETPIIARVSEETVYLDLRTVHPGSDRELLQLLGAL